MSVFPCTPYTSVPWSSCKCAGWEYEDVEEMKRVFRVAGLAGVFSWGSVARILFCFAVGGPAGGGSLGSLGISRVRPVGLHVL